MTSPSSDRNRRRQGGRGDWQTHGWGRGWDGDWRRPDWRASAWMNGDWDAPRDSVRRANRRDDVRRDSSRDDLPRETERDDVPRKPVRIGDAERDRAVSLLSDHFVAGRLTQAEFEERSEQATRARYTGELEPLFDDLPTSRDLQLADGSQPVRSRRRPGPPPPILMLLPFVMLGLMVSSIALAAPWLLWGFFWVFLISGMSRRSWHHRG
ncbi:MAG TPA: DUF1707 domain-containing protein [Kribbella sp.]|jgi:hypothetical protein